jgi:hypothetical protein
MKIKELDRHMDSLAFKLNLAMTDSTAYELITDEEIEVLKRVVADSKEVFTHDF